MAAIWLIAGLFVATASGFGALLLGASILVSIAVYAATGCLTLCLGLMAAALDDLDEFEAGPGVPTIPAE